jgi:hypothetical protein
MTYAHHVELGETLQIAPHELFGRLDNPERLGRHMSRSSWMMLGGRMHYQFDEARGSRVGSVIAMRGRILGVRVDLQEVVIERSEPSRKVWETIGEPRLLVIGAYRMGFDIKPDEGNSRLDGFLDYNLPRSGMTRLLAALLGDIYARWCVGAIIEDARAPATDSA